MSTTSAPHSLSPVAVAAREITLHGRPVAFLEAGADSGGPVVVLLHGLASSSQTWAGVLPLLGRHAHVIAPDLLGHGRSAKPRSGDYSLGAYAAGVRDLLITLGLDRATVAGHSFGGGVAMQFAYQFPELAQRLVLVSSGGLGRAVNVALRAATLPGTSMVLRALPAISPPWLTRLARRVVPALDRPDLVGMATAVASFTDRGARGAFAQTVRGALDLSGQRLEGTERLYLLADVPVLLVGGSEDSVIPVDHTTSAHDLLPGSHLEIFDGAGHFPHVEQPARFADLVMRFLTGTSAARSDLDSLRRRLQAAPSPATDADPL